MASLQTPLLLSFVFLIFLSLTKTHNSIGISSVISLTNDNASQTVHEAMQTYGLPPGLIPDNVKSYTLHNTGSFVITLNSECYVKFDRLVYYDTDIRGKLSYGAVDELSGIEAKKGIFWFSVTAIEASENGDKIKFKVGPFSESFPASHFTEIRTCGSKLSLRTPLDLYDTHKC